IIPAYDNHTQFIDSITGEFVLDLVGADPLGGSCLAHEPSADGQFFINSNADSEIGVWWLEDRQLVRIYRGHTDTITAVELSPDGSLLYSGSTDNTIKVWPVDWQ
ncbi:MAG: hypothetical protein JRJ19_14940, partial [Deltaproteobacteria bacterium]|nr:hypothetical protein [Deltaproteobacteria bacterium]